MPRRLNFSKNTFIKDKIFLSTFIQQNGFFESFGRRDFPIKRRLIKKILCLLYRNFNFFFEIIFYQKLLNILFLHLTATTVTSRFFPLLELFSTRRLRFGGVCIKGLLFKDKLDIAIMLTSLSIASKCGTELSIAGGA